MPFHSPLWAVGLDKLLFGLQFPESLVNVVIMTGILWELYSPKPSDSQAPVPEVKGIVLYRELPFL